MAIRGYTTLTITVYLLLYITTSTASPKEDWIRGVPPAEQNLFKGALFACRREPTRKIPISHVNDNYCDCNDGSDEPGTSACTAGSFFCLNKGHQGERIFSSRVNDGICDCCDGSDEYEGRVTCTNSCAGLAAIANKLREEEKAKYLEGLKIKEKWITEAQQGIKEKQGEVERLKQDIEKFKKVVETLEAEKVAIEEAEKLERTAILDAKQAEKQQEQADQPPASTETPPSEVKPEAPIEGNEEENFEQTKEEIEDEEAEAAEHAAKLLADPGYKTRIRRGQRTPPRHESAKAAPVEEESEALKAILEAKRKKEDELRDARRELSDAERKLKDIEQLLASDFGPQLEFFALNEKCFDHKSREYTYTLCPYNEVKQSQTSLGKFEKWEPAYTTMLYTNGQQCWGGPKRSAAVTLQCGEQNELHSVSEPSKCEYAMKFTTPAACSKAHYDMMLLEDGHSGEHEHEAYF